VIKVKLADVEGGCALLSDVGEIVVRTSKPGASNAGGAADFAAWFFLPIAMRLGKNLHIEGAGHPATCENFRTLSEIWRSWLPGHFDVVTCDFAAELEPDSHGNEISKDLLLYSGGVDAAFTGLRRLRKGMDQDLLTVHGMDYDLSNEARFDALMEKTSTFARSLSDTRIIVRTDAYTLYHRYGVNIRGHHLTHSFALAGSAFFHANRRRIILGADERLDRQFMMHPWGTNTATDFLFDDGRSAIVTDGDDCSRIEKLRYLRSSREALKALSFCWNRRLQPQNCGVCAKCLRTKLLFLADNGEVPAIFLDERVPNDWLRRLRYWDRAGLVAVSEIFDGAVRNGTELTIPGYHKAFDEALGYYRRRRAREHLLRAMRPRSIVRSVRRRLLSGFPNATRRR
jgi:hypothetical protein